MLNATKLYVHAWNNRNRASVRVCVCVRAYMYACVRIHGSMLGIVCVDVI